MSRINAQTEVDGDWKKFVDEQRENDLVVIIEEEKDILRITNLKQEIGNMG